MHWLARIVLIIIGNAAALWLVNRYIAGFGVNMNLGQLLLLAFVLALLNFFLKPILTLILGPIIVLTLGIGIIIVNGIIIWLLPIIAAHVDFLQGSITIQTIPALLIGTLIISAVNLLIHLAI